jgi:putative heme-binding domain-containing protein
VQSRGQRVGPDLSGIGARPKETLLVDLFDASRQVTPQFVAYTLLTDDGQVMTGVLVSETAESVTLRRAEGEQDFVLRSKIEELRSTGKSLMPDGFEETFSPEDVADLLAFLAQPDARLLSKPK